MFPEQVNGFVSAGVMLLMLVFARVGTAMIMMPAFGDVRVPAQAKIALAFLASLVMLPTLPLPEPPQRVDMLVGLIAIEALIGAFIGMAGRIFMAAFHLLGAQVGFAAGLSNAMAPPDANFDGANTLAALLQVAALALIFATDTHHVMISGLARSYHVMPVGQPMLGDMAEQMARIGGSSFYIAAAVGAPFIIFSILVNLALGLANRVMPAMQVFFVAGPGLIIIGLGLLFLLVPAIMNGVIGEMGKFYLELVR